MLVELAALALPLVGLLGMLIVLMRPTRAGGTMLMARSLLGLRGYRLRSDGGPGTIFITALAASSLASSFAPTGAALAAVGIVGLIAGALGPGLFIDVIGAVAAVHLAWTAVVSPACGAEFRGLLVVGVLLMGVVFVAVAAVSFWRAGRRRLPGLAAFGLVELILFAAAPGGAVLGGDPVRWAASLALVVLVGVLAGLAPAMAVELTGLAVVVVELWAGNFAPTWACADSTDLVTPIVLFSVAYLLAGARRR